MQDRRELIKAIIEAVGPLIKAENETLKTILMAEIKSVKQDIKRLEQGQKALEQGQKSIEQKLDEKLADHETRISQLEEDSKFLPHSH